MDASHHSLLNLWRLSARHWRLDDGIAAIAQELHQSLSFQRLLVLKFSPGGSGLVTVAQWAQGAMAAKVLPARASARVPAVAPGTALDAASRPVPGVAPDVVPAAALGAPPIAVPEAPPGAGLAPLPAAMAPPSNASSAVGAIPLARLLAWCREGQAIQGPVALVEEQVPGLVPPDWSGEILALGLLLDAEPLGLLLMGVDPPGTLSEEAGPRMLALCEPIAMALRNHQRLRELLAQREAAEADRRSLLARLGRRELTDTLIGADAGLREVMRGVELVAPATAPVLILGETGSGKEVIARAIHSRSARAQGPFLRVNCGAIPPDLVDSELFGHEKGSFTGAGARRLGWFERADRGTLFLDEIGELTPAIQVRLLRILQDGSFERVGGQQTLRVDVRLIAATHRDLRAMVRDGQFRADLWYRINVFPLHLPALRERPEDIPALANHFAEKAAVRLGLALQLPTPEDLDLLRAYPWPGNVRELAAVIERAAILGDGQGLEVQRALGAGPLMHGAQLPAHAVNAESYAANAIANATSPAGIASGGGTATSNGTTAVGTATVIGNGSAATVGSGTGTGIGNVSATAETVVAGAATANAAGGLYPAIAPAGVIEPLDDAIRHHIERALAQCYGRVEGPFGAARLLAVNPDTLRSRMRKLGISRDPFKP